MSNRGSSRFHSPGFAILLPAALAVLGGIGQLPAQWTLIDDFDSYDNSSTTSLGATPGNLTGDVWIGEWDGTAAAFITDNTIPGDHSLAVTEGSGWRGAETDLANNFASDFSLADGNTATYFFQTMAEGTATDCMLGLSESRARVDINDSWQDYAVMPFVAGGNLQVYGDNGTGGIIGAMTNGEWYNVWLVVNNSTKEFDIYWSTGTNPGTPAYSGVQFGRVTDPVNLEAFAAMNNGTDRVHVDHLYMTSGVDTTYPIPPPQDTEGDGLPDAWEQQIIDDDPGDAIDDVLDVLPGDDHDGDGSTNHQEFTAGSDPTDPNSTPADTDADGLSDAWELATFGTIAYGPSDDPDGDGEDTSTELTNGSAPNNRASDSTDTDGDGLPDSWEQAHFGTLSHNAGSDPDGDRFGNLQEQEAATDPADPASRPAGTAVTLVPLDDGNNSTSEFGYAGSSTINTAAFARSALLTVSNQQFIAWFGRHQFDPAASFNNTIWIGRRALGSSEWEVFRHPSYTANNIADGHDVVCFGIDGDGYMHLSWGMHGDAFHYTRSTSPVTGSGPIELGPDTAMTGRENGVTYPQFLTLPDGDLLYLFREGASGDGDTFLNRYDTGTQTWSNVHTSGGGSVQEPFIRASNASPDENAYPNMPQLGGDGDDLILAWTFRQTPAFQTNHDFFFARSPDGGASWERFDGSPYALPITPGAAEQITSIPQGYSLINQAGMCLDQSGHPVIASWWSPGTGSGDYTRQYQVIFRDPSGGTWETRQVSNRTIDNPGTLFGDGDVRNLGRPVVVTDDDDRIIVAYRDNQGTNGLTIVHSLPRADDPDRLLWIEFDLTAANLGSLEPVIDYAQWRLHKRLHVLYQAAAGQGFTPAANTAARISVLEWDAAAYFRKLPQPSIETVSGGQDIRITCPSEPSWDYRLWTGTDLQGWQEVETKQGTGAPIEFLHAGAAGDDRRFWRIELREGGF